MKDTTSAATTADELASSVDVTLASWRAAFESSSSYSPSTKAKSTTSIAATIEEGSVLNSKQSGSEVVVSSNSYCDVLLPRSSRQRLSCSTNNNNSNEMSDGSKSNKIIVWKDSPDDYHKRLATFRSETYFAKPLCLSPLVCAAFG